MIIIESRASRAIPNTFTESQVAVLLAQSASTLGHVPATLTLSRYLIKRGWLGYDTFKPVRNQLERLVAKGGDANVLTAQAMVRNFMQDPPAKVASLYRQALAIAGDEPFQWKSSCLLGLAEVLVVVGKKEEAYPLLKQAAALNNREAVYDLAIFNQERNEELLLKSAVSGTPQAWKLLADQEFKKFEAATAAGDSKAAVDHTFRSGEWSRLSAEFSKLKAQSAK
jgi:hypothetical protein